MPRNISFALTTEQFRNRTKTVTRRMGWKNLKPGDVLCGVIKAMGLKPGEKIEKLGLIRVVDARREPLNRVMTAQDTVDEGFPEMRPAEFIAFFCRSHKRCTPDSIVTRIEFEYM